MPNHITNRLTLKGDTENVKKCLSEIRSEKYECIDFNKIVPMPESLMIDSISHIETAVKVALKLPLHKNSLIASLELGNRDNFKSPLEFTDSDFDTYLQVLNNVKKYGHFCWYSWSIENWGTKWNAYNQKSEGNTISFDTAWSGVYKLIVKLSQMHPDIEFEYHYADEYTGSNTGWAVIKSGVGELVQFEDLSKAAYEHCFLVNPDSKDNYKLIGDSYQYIDED